MTTADRLLADAAYAVLTALGRTLRFSEEGRAHLAAARASGRPVLFVFWHDRLLYLCYRLAGEGLVTMISRSRDGDLVARLAANRGIPSVRGSSSRGGSAAVRALVRRMRRHGLSGGITPDGPRGPRHVFQPGALLVARLADAVVVPVAIGFSRRKEFSSWDRFLLPWPFARARVVFGEPVRLAEGGGDAALEAQRADLERRLMAVTAAADRPF